MLGALEDDNKVTADEGRINPLIDCSYYVLLNLYLAG
jgi:hypothetical protein